MAFMAYFFFATMGMMSMKQWHCVLAITVIGMMATTAAVARQTAIDANGNAGIVVSHKTGAKARVSVAFASRFQAYIDDIEARGASVRFMGGIRRGHCWSGGMHPCGKALDVCQTGRGRVDHRCHLPSRHELSRIAAAHGLFEGGQWCHSDYGHVQVGESAAACGSQPGSTLVASARSRRHTRTVTPAPLQPDRLTAAY